LNAAQQLLADIGDPNHPDSTLTRPVWSNIAWETVDAFLSQYNFDPRSPHEMNSIRQYLTAQAQQNELVEWTIAIPGRYTLDTRLGVEPLLTVRGVAPNRISRSRLRNKPYDIGTLVNPATANETTGNGDEEIGLTSEQLANARNSITEDISFPRALRSQRNPREGLLLLYPISPFSSPQDGSSNRVALFDDPALDGVTVLGIAIVFPVSNSAATIEYVVGSVVIPNEDLQ
ncbi:MAG: hypothetical protein HGA87_07325, partial [Desulfobulbaceae bacterium]|nr:hypothetical protein [Desulfobulbaceae bacterium]